MLFLVSLGSEILSKFEFVQESQTMYMFSDFLTILYKFLQNQGISVEVLEMDSISLMDENYELGYHPSPSSFDQTDHSPIETPFYSILSRDSFAYCRTNSETSAFSENTDDNSDSEVASPICCPGMKCPKRAALSRLGINQHQKCLDEKNRD